MSDLAAASRTVETLSSFALRTPLGSPPASLEALPSSPRLVPPAPHLDVHAPKGFCLMTGI